MYDIPHLIKSIRNTLLKRDIECSDGIVSWDCVKELFKLEKEKSTKMCPKLTLRHVYPNSWQKMKVSYATQVFSHTISRAVKTANNLNKLFYTLYKIKIPVDRYVF